MKPPKPLNLESKARSCIFRFILPLLLLMSVSSLAQSQTVIRGKISDVTGAPMPGVNIIIKNTSIGTTTDAAGVYSLTLPQNSTENILLFSFIGYNTQESRVLISRLLTPAPRLHHSFLPYRRQLLLL